MRRGTLILLLAAAGTLQAQQPSPPLADRAIRGQVVSEMDRTPLRRARVDVTAGNRRIMSVFTDDVGRFAIDAPGTGPVTVTVEKGGYATARATLDRTGTLAPLTVRLPRGAAIAGRVVNERGAPAVGSAVTARLLDAELPGFPQFFATSTDDLGAYRLGGLPPGRFEIAANRPPPALPPIPGPSGWSETPAPNMAIGVSNERLLGGTVIAATAPSPPVQMRTTKNAAGVLTTTLVPESRPVEVVTVRTGEDIEVPDMTVPALLDPVIASMNAGQESRSPAANAAVVRGRVITATGEPVVNAVVALTQLAGPVNAVRGGVTDGAGAFEIRSLPPGAYTLRATGTGFATAIYGQQRPDDAGRTIDVSAGQIVDGLDVVMPRHHAIAGMVTDEHGEPLQGAIVQALQIRDARGRLTAVPASLPRRTDDRGRYRLFPLPPGEYIVASSVSGVVSGSAATGYTPIFYPGTPLVDGATPVVVTGEATGVNIAFIPLRAVTVRGVAREDDGPLIDGTARLVVSRRSGALALEFPLAPIGEDGTFAFANVPRGEYAVQVLGNGPGRTGFFGVTHVSVGDTDPAAITVRTSRGATLEGRLVIEGGTLPVGPQGPFGFSVAGVSLDADRARPDGGGAFVVSSEGTFYLSGLFGPTAFALRRAPSESWYLKAVMVNGLDVTDSSVDFDPLPRTVTAAEIVVSRHGATLTGRVTDRESPVSNYSVVIFSVFRDQWLPHSRRLRFASPGRDGAFRIAGLPPGDYYVAAVDRIAGTAESGEWQNADVLTRLVTASERLTIREGDARDLALRLVRR